MAIPVYLWLKDDGGADIKGSVDVQDREGSIEVVAQEHNLYIPTDNTAASNTEAIANILVPAGVPAIAGEEGICSGCGVATLSISYYDLGVTTGKMAAKILTGEADISTMPIEYTDATPKYNPTICEELGIQPLDGYEAIEG